MCQLQERSHALIANQWDHPRAICGSNLRERLACPCSLGHSHSCVTSWSGKNPKAWDLSATLSHLQSSQASKVALYHAYVSLKSILSPLAVCHLVSYYWFHGVFQYLHSGLRSLLPSSSLHTTTEAIFHYLRMRRHFFSASLVSPYCGSFLDPVTAMSTSEVHHAT